MGYLQPNIIRDFLVFDQTSNEPKVRVTSGRICDFDFFESGLDEEPEKSTFFARLSWG